MNTHRSRAIAIGVVALVALGAGGVNAASAQSTGPSPDPVRCQWSVSDLPHTADAVEGWYRGCPPSDMPHSPTGVEGWTH